MTKVLADAFEIQTIIQDMGNLNYTLVPALCEPVDNSIQSTIPFTSRNIAVTVDKEKGVR